MKIIIDTNILVQDFWLKGINFNLLFNKTKETGDLIYIPQLVIDETLNKYEEKLIQGKEAVVSAINTTNRITGLIVKNPFEKFNLKEELKKYKEHIYDIVDSHNIQILPYPKTKHEKIVKKAIRKKKPFKKSGDGYRDSLIWENMKSVMPTEHKLIPEPEFIVLTNNTADFADKEGKLHPDLIQEIIDEGLWKDGIKLYTNLKSLIDEQITPTLEKLDKICAKLNHNAYPDVELKNEISNFLDKEIINREFDSETLEIDYEYESPTISYYYEVFDITVNRVVKTTNGQLLLSVGAAINCGIDIFIFKSDYYSRPDEDRPGIISRDWNDHYHFGQIEKELLFDIKILMNSEMEVLSIELETINNNYA